MLSICRSAYLKHRTFSFHRGGGGRGLSGTKLVSPGGDSWETRGKGEGEGDDVQFSGLSVRQNLKFNPQRKDGEMT